VLSGPGPFWPTCEQGPGASGETHIGKKPWKNDGKMWKTAKCQTEDFNYPYLTYNQTSLKNQERHLSKDGEWRGSIYEHR